MKCLDDCHTYLMDTFLYPRSADFRAERLELLPRGKVRNLDNGILHFYEMREDGTRVDGVTNEEVLRVLIHRLKFLNGVWQGGKFHCVENSIAIDDLEHALQCLENRTANRMARKVEGTHNP